jgi:hypothetical protein
METSLVPHDANRASRLEMKQTIEWTDEIMSCEGKKLPDLIQVLDRQRQQGSKLDWFLEIRIQYNLFDIKTIKYVSQKHTLNELRGYTYKLVSPMHEILSVIPMRH